MPLRKLIVIWWDSKFRFSHFLNKTKYILHLYRVRINFALLSLFLFKFIEYRLLTWHRLVMSAGFGAYKQCICVFLFVSVRLVFCFTGSENFVDMWHKNNVKNWSVHQNISCKEQHTKSIKLLVQRLVNNLFTMFMSNHNLIYSKKKTISSYLVLMYVFPHLVCLSLQNQEMEKY